MEPSIASGEIALRDPRVKGLRFSRNFGKEAALLAGLTIASGDAVVTIDSDLQHPPQSDPCHDRRVAQGQHGRRCSQAQPGHRRRA